MEFTQAPLMELLTCNDGIENTKPRINIPYFYEFVANFLIKMKVKIVLLRTTVSLFIAAY